MIVRITPLILAASLVIGCGATKKKDPEPIAEWRTQEGRRAVKIDLAETLIAAGNTQTAMAIVNQLREEYGPNDPELNLLQGMALRREGVSSEAERLLLKSRARLQRDPRPFKELGLLYADDQKVALAIEQFQRASRLDNADASAWNNLGYLHLSQGHHQEAREALEKAVSLDGTDPRARNNLGFALVAMGDEKDALKIFQSVGGQAAAWYNVGIAYERVGNLTAASRALRSCLEIEPDYEMANEAVDRIAEALRQDLEKKPEEQPEEPK